MALLSEASVAVLEANVGYLESMKNEMQKMNAAGFVSKADADQVELNYNTVVNALNYAKGQSKVAKMLLKLQMGYPVEREVVLADELDQLVIGAANASTLTTLSFDPSQTIDYQVMANQIAGAELQLKNQYMQFLPSLGVSYQNNIQYMSPEANIFSDAAVDLPTSLVGGQISIPLFSSGNRLAKVAEAKIQRDQANIGLNQLEQALIMQHQNATNEYFRAIADYLAQKKNVELAKTIRNQRRREFEEGVGSSTELTQSETQYQQALQSLFLAAQTALDKQAELEYLMNKHTQN
jgi:outer membrane protein TolC